jgi:hypothetical protein
MIVPERSSSSDLEHSALLVEDKKVSPEKCGICNK